MTPRDRIALDMLTKAAQDGAECPSNALLAAALGTGLGAAQSAVRALESQGVIVVERGQKARRVTLVATGQQTAPIHGGEHWRTRGADYELAQRDQLAEHVANGLTVKQAQKEMRMGSDTVYRLWRQICEGLGPQAT